MDTRKLSLIARYNARYSVRGGVGLVFLLLSLTFGLLVAHSMLQPVELLSKQIQERMGEDDADAVAEQVVDEITDLVQPVVAWMLQTNTSGVDDVDPEAEERAEDWADYLLEEQPALLTGIFLILLLGWPLIIAFGAFDLYAGDIGSRQLRYQLLRADRGSIYFGRLFGTLLTFFIVILMLGGTVCLYMGANLSLYSWGELFSWTLWGVLVLAMITLPYTALCAWISASVSGSFASLTIVSVIIGGVPLVAMLARQSFESAGYLNYLLPWGFQLRLFHNEPLQVGLAAGGCLVHAALFGWLGYRKFTRRDL